MRFIVSAVILGLTGLEAVMAIPSGYTSPYARSFRKVYLRRVPCGSQATTCDPRTRTFVLPSVPVARVPLLKQVFTTVTRKHDNLNTAHAESGKGINIKYQAGPSLELEGAAGASGYAKLKGAEHAEDSTSYPYVYMHPTKEIQYSAPVSGTKCIEICPGQAEQYAVPIEKTQCVENC